MKKQILCFMYAVTIASACHANLKFPGSFADDIEVVLTNYRLESERFKDVAQKALKKDVKSILRDQKVVNIIEHICKHMLRDELKIDSNLLKKAFSLSSKIHVFSLIEDPANKKEQNLAETLSYVASLDCVFYLKYLPVVGTYFSHEFKDTNKVVWYNFTGASTNWEDLEELELNADTIQDLIEDDVFLQNLYAWALSDIKNIDPEIIYEINTLDTETKFIVRVAVYRLTLFAMISFIFDHFDSNISQDILKCFYGTDEPIERD